MPVKSGKEGRLDEITTSEGKWQSMYRCRQHYGVTVFVLRNPKLIFVDSIVRCLLYKIDRSQQGLFW